MFSDSVVIEFKDTIIKTRTEFIELISPSFLLDSTIWSFGKQYDTIRIKEDPITTVVEVARENDRVKYRIITKVDSFPVIKEVVLTDTLIVKEEVKVPVITELVPRRWKWLVPSLIGLIIGLAIWLYFERKKK